jgi:DNA-directed RNA polymerase subunit M/transcription elongation factor TFIIS
MDQPATPSRTCPECGSGDFAFRGRRTIMPKPGEQGPEEIETKYRCKACKHEWKVRVPQQKAG